MSFLRHRRHAALLVPLVALSALASLAGCAVEDAPPPASAAARPGPQPQVYMEPAAQPAYGYPAATVGYALPVAAVPIADVGSTAGGGWPPIPYSNFLATSEESHRQLMWSYFRRAEAESRAFATSPQRWVPIVAVQSSAPTEGAVVADWKPSGVLELRATGGPGIMFHELFHPAYHHSEFEDPPQGDGPWNEAWCDAFRYYAERQFLSGPPSTWSSKLDRYTTMTEHEVIGDGTHWVSRKYWYPASLIVKRNGGPNGSIASLRALWNQLIVLRQQRGGPVMSDFFGYHVPKKSDMQSAEP